VDFFLILAALILLCNLYAAIDIIAGTGKMRNLSAVKPLPEKKRPRVSIIVPACNEADTIEPALRSLLNLEYEPLEIIVINDRSTDRTAEVLTGIQQKHPRLIIREVTELPDGWLGKNHALHQGAQMAVGEFLLFTDADIVFEKSTLSRAMSLIVSEQLDHLSLIFKNIARGLLLNAMMVDAGGGLFFLFKPWKVSDPKNKHFIGVGAFNLIRTSVYLQIGGHETIRMHPIDDIMLGKIIKQNGFRQECLSGYNFLTVHWYESPRKMINGLMKNIFALYNFRVFYVLVAVLMILVLTILPIWAVFLTSGITRVIFLLAVATRLFSSAYGAWFTKTSIKIVPFSLLTPYINIYILVKGLLKTFADNGIDWRGTHYPLDQLKKNLPLL
jgi:glycosyltransferase involved in cell wall biosynthesis